MARHGRPYVRSPRGDRRGLPARSASDRWPGRCVAVVRAAQRPLATLPRGLDDHRDDGSGRWRSSSRSGRARSSTRGATRRSRSRSRSTTGRWPGRRCRRGPRPGEHEAVELRDGDTARYGGKGVEKAVAAVLDEIGPELVGHGGHRSAGDRPAAGRSGRHPGQVPAGRQRAARGVAGGGQGGGGVVAGWSCSATSAGPNAHVLPVPMMNIINGGAHADTRSTCRSS